MSADDDRYAGVIAELGKMWHEFQDFKTQLSTEIAEYKKTVNAALSILGQEAIKFQHDTEQRITADQAARRERQKVTDRKDIAVLIGMGCLIVMNFIGIGVALGVLAWLVLHGAT